MDTIKLYMQDGSTRTVPVLARFSTALDGKLYGFSVVLVDADRIGKAGVLVHTQSGKGVSGIDLIRSEESEHVAARYGKAALLRVINERGEAWLAYALDHTKGLDNGNQ